VLVVATTQGLLVAGDAGYKSSCDRLFSLTSVTSSPDKWIVQIDGTEISKRSFVATAENIRIEAAVTRTFGGEVVELLAYDPAVTTTSAFGSFIAPTMNHSTTIAFKLDTKRNRLAESGASIIVEFD